MQRLTTALFILLAMSGGPATAAPAWHSGPLKVAERPSGISLDQATEQVRRQTGGRILSAETVDKKGRRVHRIKVLTPDHKVVIREISAGSR